jgi:hypothetical protein
MITEIIERMNKTIEKLRENNTNMLVQVAKAEIILDQLKNEYNTQKKGAQNE